MPLDFNIAKTEFSEPLDSQGLVCFLNQDTHEELFAHARTSEVPNLMAFENFYSDAYVETKNLENLIREIEEITMRFPHNSPVKSFLAPFHSLCVIAWTKEAGISAFCD